MPCFEDDKSEEVGQVLFGSGVEQKYVIFIVSQHCFISNGVENSIFETVGIGEGAFLEGPFGHFLNHFDQKLFMFLVFCQIQQSTTAEQGNKGLFSLFDGNKPFF